MWDPKENDAVVKALAVVCEVTQTSFSKGAVTLIVKQLSAFPAQQVLASLERCAAECKFKLTLADVVSRLDDGRPGAEEAWSSFPKSEDAAGLVTQEMSVAWGAAAPLYESDQIGARMAFKEAYERQVRAARARGEPPAWRVSPGFDKASTESVALEGLKRGLLTEQQAKVYALPEHVEVARTGKALPAPENMAKLKQLIAGVLK